MRNNYLFRIVLFGFFILPTLCCNSACSGEKRPEFSFWVVGSSGVKVRFGTKIYDRLDSLRAETGLLDDFLYTLAEEPLTIDQIRERSGMTRSQVEYLITSLEPCNFIKKYDRSRWATTLPVVTDDQMVVIRKDLAPMADSVAQYLVKETQRIRKLYDEAKSPTDPSWEVVSHLFIDKFIIDGSFHSNLNRLKRESDAGEPDDGEKRMIPAFLLHRGDNFSTFGCNWYEFEEGEDHIEIFVLHGAILDRYDIAMNKYAWDKTFSAGLFKISPGGGMDSLTDREKEILRDLGWISDERLMVPIVNASTIKSLMPVIKNIGRDAAEVAFAEFADLTDSYNNSSYAKFLDHEEDYIQVLIHSLFGLTIEQLVRVGAVSQVPGTVPESFGVYIVSGRVY